MPQIAPWKVTAWIVCSMVFALSTTRGGDSPTISIADARAQSDRSKATVEGFITVAPGTFASSTSEQGFAIQSGDAGIYVSMDTPVDLAPGDQVRVTGTLAEMSKLTVLIGDASLVEKLAGHRLIAPQATATGNVDEDAEGRLIKVSGVVTRKVVGDLPYGLKVFINDGSGEVQLFIHMRKSRPLVDLEKVDIGDRVEAVGLGFQYGDIYEVNPRSPADFVELIQ